MHEILVKSQMFQFRIFSNPLISLANWSLKCLTTWQVVNCQMVHRGSIRFLPRYSSFTAILLAEKYYFRKNKKKIKNFEIEKSVSKIRLIYIGGRIWKKIVIRSILDRYRCDTMFDKDLEFSIMFFWNKTAYFK